MYSGDPVAVIGHGPVGQTAALLLARWGIPVVLLDRRSGPDPAGSLGHESRAICQQRDVLDVWSSLGAGAIAEEGLTWTTARTFYRDEELFNWSFTDPGPLPPFVNLSQRRTEELLEERIAASPLIDVRWGWELTDLAQDSTGVTLTSGTSSLRASYAVASAGARADRVRELLGLSFEGEAFDDLFLICDIRADLPGWETERRFHFDPAWNPDRQVLIHPCPGSTYRIDWQVPPTFDLAAEAGSGGLEARIRTVIGNRPYELLWRSVYRFQTRCVDRMRAGRVLVAGDCAHLVAPFGARGLNSGVPDAENAAWKLAFVLHGWAPPSLLESYDAERRAAAAENISVTSATMRFLVPQSAAEWTARRSLLAAAVADPDARARVDSGRFAEPFWYLDSPLTTPSPSRVFPGRPARGEPQRPVPGVLIPDAALSGGRRLRDLVRSGVLALLADGVDADAVAEALRTCPAPHSVVHLSDLGGPVADLLEARPGELWLIRPDGHIAAVLPDPAPPAITRALARLLGTPVP